MKQKLQTNNITNKETCSLQLQASTYNKPAAVKDYCAKQLQGYLPDRSKAYPELIENDCYHIRKNLYSAATCGLWLDGARGKK